MPLMPDSPSLPRLREAREKLMAHLRPTPLVLSEPLSERAGRKVWLKLETQQPTGSFKVRPAFHGLLSRLEEARARGVLTTSSGNFAQAVAYAARKLGARAAIVMMDDTAPFKVERTRALGAEVVFCGPSFEQRFARLDELERARGGVVLHPYDSRETIEGDASLGLELLDALEGDFSVIVPASGGGLAAGVAAAVKQVRPASYVRIAQPERGGAIARSLEAGTRVNVGKVRTVADALIASMPGELAFELIRRHVDSAGLVAELEIIEAMRLLAEEHKLIVEPGGAVGVADLLSGRAPLPPGGGDCVCVITGGNVPLERMTELLREPGAK